MKLIIYETTHHENLPAILDLAVLRSDSIAVFLDELSYQHLHPEIKDNWPGVEYIIRKEGEEHRKFISSMFEFAQKGHYTHLHLCTISNNYLYLAWKLLRTPHVHVSLTVHEINYYRSYLFKDFRDITECLAKIYLHRRIRRFRALIPRMKIEIEKYFPLAKTTFIPSRFYVFPITKNKISKNKIVIPGTVENNRRNYEFAINFISIYLVKEEFKLPVNIVLLGNSDSNDGATIVQRLKKLENEGLHFTYYSAPVTANEYARQMNDAKLIWSPINLLTNGSRGQKEIYGITKSPGLNSDLIQFPKQAFVPADFNIPTYFKQAMKGYVDESDLWQKMKKLLQEENLELLQNIEKDLSVLTPVHFTNAFDILMQT